MASSAVERSCMAVTMMTGMSGSALRSHSTRLRPSISGMTMSLRTNVDGICDQEFPGQAAIAYGRALVAQRFQKSGNHFSDGLFVVDNQ